MKERIIQASPGHTGSTILVNLLYGLLEPNSDVNFQGKTENLGKKFITKTHKLNLDSIINNLKDNEIYFVMSERNDKKVKKLINQKYRNYKNVLIFNFFELLETENNTISQICINAEKKLRKFLPTTALKYAKGDLQTMKNRIIAMNATYEKIKNEPFSYVNKFYHIHGSHRNRK